MEKFINNSPDYYSFNIYINQHSLTFLNQLDYKNQEINSIKLNNNHGIVLSILNELFTSTKTIKKYDKKDETLYTWINWKIISQKAYLSNLGRTKIFLLIKELVKKQLIKKKKLLDKTYIAPGEKYDYYFSNFRTKNTSPERVTKPNIHKTHPLIPREEEAASLGRFKKPTIKEIEEYVKKKNLKVDAKYIFDHYESKGWMVGRNRMKDWKAAVRNWERRKEEFNKQYRNNGYVGYDDLNHLATEKITPEEAEQIKKNWEEREKNDRRAEKE